MSAIFSRPQCINTPLLTRTNLQWGFLQILSNYKNLSVIGYHVLSIWLWQIETETNDSQFPRDIFEWIIVNEDCWILVQIILKFVSNCEFIITNHWIKYWFGAWQATSYNLTQYGLNLMTRKCILLSRWFKYLFEGLVCYGITMGNLCHMW